MPAVAVCIPLYNKEQFIGETIQSVLDQTFADFELVILDNACTDRSTEIVRSFADPRIALERNAVTVPPTDNFNKAVALSSAPLVKVLCADDLIHPLCLERQVAAMEEDPTLAMVTCRQDMIDESGRVLAGNRGLRTRDLVGRQRRETVVRRLVRHGGNPIGNPGNVVFRRAAFEAVGGFPTEEDFFTIDVGMWIRLLVQGHYLGIPETLTSFRINGGSDSRELGGQVVRLQRQFIHDVCRENADIVRRRDKVFSASRAPLTSLRHRLLISAAGAAHSRRTQAARRVIAVGRRTSEGRMMKKAQTTPEWALGLRVGELVEVRGGEEIRATLDERGEVDALPFMPEMLQFCGRRFRVDKLAIKLCDTINWSGMYRMDHAVHLAGLRCDGQSHGGCQAGCLIYWKEAWLKRVDAGDEAEAAPPPPHSTGRFHLELTVNATADRTGGPTASDEVVYSCQATELLRAAPDYLPHWDVRQYVLDVRSGNAGPLAAIRSVGVGAFNKYQALSSKVLPQPMRIRGGHRYPFVIAGRLQKTPNEVLDLQAGEMVRVKSAEEIVETLDVANRNRGMSFDAEMLKYCGRQARVLRRVDRIIDEKTGKMQHLRNPCIILDDVICTSDYHRLCPRGIYPYWREIWLERV